MVTIPTSKNNTAPKCPILQTCTPVGDVEAFSLISTKLFLYFTCFLITKTLIHISTQYTWMLSACFFNFAKQLSGTKNTKLSPLLSADILSLQFVVYFMPITVTWMGEIALPPPAVVLR